MAEANIASEANRADLNISPRLLQGMLILAGLACCMAMAMPQVHIVSYCADLGYGPARGAEMLSMMLLLGVVSRIASGFLADRIGGAWTLLIGSVMQGLALTLYLFFDGLTSLYIISGIFGLFQGGIVPMYAVICRDYLPPKEAGQRIGLVIAATIAGMALGGWMSGVLYDLTGSYRMAFLHGILWNAVNLAVCFWLIIRRMKAKAAMQVA
jgi:MFS family permease